MMMMDPDRDRGLYWPAEPPEVFRRVSECLGDLEAVGKGGWNPDQKFKFRSIDDVMTALHPIMGKHGIIPVPAVLERSTETRTTRSGAGMNVTHLRVRYRFYAPDGSYIDAVVWGEGADTSDKSTTKALAMAYKYALIQTFCIATEDVPDPDGTGTEAVSVTSREAERPPTPIEEILAAVPKVTNLDALTDLLREGTRSGHLDAKVGKEGTLRDVLFARRDVLVDEAQTAAVAKAQERGEAP